MVRFKLPNRRSPETGAWVGFAGEHALKRHVRMMRTNDTSRRPGRLAGRRISVGGWTVLLVMAGAGLASGQTLPSAGSILRQVQRSASSPLPPRQVSAFAAPAPLTSISGPTVTVKRFRFQGNHLLSNRQLDAVVKTYLNRPLNFTQLQNAAIAVADAYRKVGWVVRAYLPQQDVTHGTVCIEVIEANFGRTRVELNGARISSARLSAIVASAQHSGRPVNAIDLDRALLLINDLPGLSAKGQLAPGDRPAQTDLLLEASAHPLLTGTVTLDNAGQRLTGASQVAVTADLSSPLRIGDLAEALYLHSKGTDFASIGYGVPLGARGVRVGVNASHLSYRIVTEQFSALDAHGHSSTVGLNASYPLVRARLENVYLSAAANENWFDNRSLSATTSRYSVESGQIGVAANRYDEFAGGGSSTASIEFEQGLVDLGGSPNEAADAATVNTAGAFYKVDVTLSRLQVITSRLSLYASAMGQYASKNLDSSEMLYLGGMSGIRAYPANEGGGSEGVLTHLEARVRLPAALSLIGFVDWGEVHFNRNPHFPGAPTSNTDVLKGGGISLAWRAPFGLTLEVAVARRIGRNPHPTSTGMDQNGTLIENRIWAEATMPF